MWTIAMHGTVANRIWGLTLPVKVAGAFAVAPNLTLEFILTILLFWEGGMPSGTVKWFNTERGFGFIGPHGGGKDVFVHISAVQRAGMDCLREGAKVTFDIVDNRGKPVADNLQVK
jgi:CspA family cold shock protein